LNHHFLIGRRRTVIGFCDGGRESNSGSGHALDFQELIVPYICSVTGRPLEIDEEDFVPGRNAVAQGIGNRVPVH
jgi:hypothetical protein